MQNNNTLKTRRRTITALLSVPFALLGMSMTSRAAGANLDSADAALNKRLQSLEAEQAIDSAHRQIRRILHAYARGWDRRDEESLLYCFWPDSTHDHGGFKGKSTDFISGGLQATANVSSMTHLISNETIDLSGDVAVCECYFLAHHRRPRTDDIIGEEDMFLQGRYLDRFEKRGDDWKIAHRQGLSDYSVINRPASTELENVPQDQLSAKKPSDPLYTALRSLGA